jgi:glucosamine-phosphate N-acetyltransferase
MNIRLIRESDYEKGYYELLKQLTDASKMSNEEFQERLYAMVSHGIQVYVIEYQNRIIGSGSLLIEPKFIHGHSLVGHIEDIIIDKEYRGKGLGRTLIEKLTSVAKSTGCYKVILNCNQNNVPFYEKLGFSKNEVKMNIYFKN